MTSHKDKLRTGPASDLYKDNWERIFGKKAQEVSERALEEENQNGIDSGDDLRVHDESTTK